MERIGALILLIAGTYICGSDAYYFAANLPFMDTYLANTLVCAQALFPDHVLSMAVGLWTSPLVIGIVSVWPADFARSNH